MQVVYDRLFKRLKENGIMIKTFRDDLCFSGSIITRLQHNGYVTTETIGKICEYFQCQPNDIMEIIFDPEITEQRKQRQIAELQRQIEQLQGK